MVSTISINPVVTENALGSFNITTSGYIQGTALDQPAIRYSLAGGILATTESLPMWGGVGISELIPGGATYPVKALGPRVGRATTTTANSAGVLTGISVFDQDHAMINTPESPVPLAASGMQVNYYRLGSGARIAVACSPNLVNLEGQITTTKVAWDFTNQQLEPYISTTISSGTYTSGSGAVSLTTAAPHGLSPGDTFLLSGMTGTGSYANLNGQQVATAGTTGSTLNFTAATGLTLTITGGNVDGTSTLLNVAVLDVQIGNSMTVQYAAGTGFATWNRSGSCAVILI